MGGEEEGTLADTSNLSIDCDMEDASKGDLDMDQTSWRWQEYLSEGFVSQTFNFSSFAVEEGSVNVLRNHVTNELKKNLLTSGTKVDVEWLYEKLYHTYVQVQGW